MWQIEPSEAVSCCICAAGIYLKHVRFRLKTKLLFFMLMFSVAFNASAQSAADLLDADLMQGVSQFQKNTQIYHYFHAPVVDSGNPQMPKKLHPQLDEKSSRDQWVNYYVSMASGSFWDLSNHNTAYTNAGPGIYLAIDPASSLEFGDTALIMNVPAGSNYLSVFKAIPLRKDTLNALVQEGYITSSQLAPAAATLGLKGGFNRLTLKNMVLSENEKFHQLVMDFVTRHQISLIEYEYKSYLAGFCKVANQAAFVFIGKNPTLADNNDYKYTNGAAVTPDFQNIPLFSGYQVMNQTPDESAMTDILNRFRYVLTQIRAKGVGAAKTLMYDNLSDNEIESLADRSYQCTRRY